MYAQKMGVFPISARLLGLLVYNLSGEFYLIDFRVVHHTDRLVGVTGVIIVVIVVWTGTGDAGLATARRMRD